MATPFTPSPKAATGQRQSHRAAQLLRRRQTLRRNALFDYHRQHRLRIKVIRIFNTYGPRMHPNDGRVVSNFIIQALTGQPLTLFGDGLQTRSFCYVDDLIDAMIRTMDTPDALPGR